MFRFIDHNHQVHEDWLPFLKEEKEKEYFKPLELKLKEDYENHQIYPPEDLIFHSLKFNSPINIKVIILGQDPYHNKGQAHGLSFSVPEDLPPPPSLKNIFKLVYSDCENEHITSGNLTPWAEQGVLLLNTILTVKHKEPLSHKNIGWEIFTDNLIKALSNLGEKVFILWGGPAIKKQALIDSDKNKVLTGPHPSPLSAYRGFFDCDHFNKTNNYLKKQKKHPIYWK